MRKLDTIQTRENLNEVYSLGMTGPGGAHHDYIVVSADEQYILQNIEFQKGPRKGRHSRHGVLDSDLLEIVRDRLKSFCTGSLPAPETKEALAHVEQALYWLNKRVEDRIERNVLGTMEK